MRTDFSRRAFRFSAPSVWNSLSQTVLISDSVSVFKSRLKTIVSNQASTEHRSDLSPSPLKLRPYDAIEIRLLLLLLLLLHHQQLPIFCAVAVVFSACQLNVSSNRMGEHGTASCSSSALTCLRSSLMKVTANTTRRTTPSGDRVKHTLLLRRFIAAIYPSIHQFIRSFIHGHQPAAEASSVASSLPNNNTRSAAGVKTRLNITFAVN